MRADPAEQHDLRAARPAEFEALARRMAEIGATRYQTNYSGGYDACASAAAAFAADRGFLAPRCVVAGVAAGSVEVR